MDLPERWQKIAKENGTIKLTSKLKRKRGKKLYYLPPFKKYLKNLPYLEKKIKKIRCL